MDTFLRQDEHMGKILTDDDPMENVLRQIEAIDNAGTQTSV